MNLKNLQKINDHSNRLNSLQQMIDTLQPGQELFIKREARLNAPGSFIFLTVTAEEAAIVLQILQERKSLVLAELTNLGVDVSS